MAKYYGLIGYAETIEKSPGNWEEQIVERNYSGDIIRDTRRWQAGSNVNDDLTINNMISIIADPFAYSNLQNIKTVKWMGSTWKVTSVEVQRPRLILTIGGIYNGN